MQVSAAQAAPQIISPANAEQQFILCTECAFIPSIALEEGIPAIDIIVLFSPSHAYHTAKRKNKAIFLISSHEKTGMGWGWGEDWQLRPGPT